MAYKRKKTNTPLKRTPIKKSVKPSALDLVPRITRLEENLEDGVEILHFVIPGQAATKKTSQRIFRRMILPSLAYMNYETHCKEFCENAWINNGNQPIDCGVSVKMRVYLRNWQIGDATGYMQSIADIMQKFQILENDSWIHWDNEGEHWFAGVDKLNPRVEITIKRLRHLKETFRKSQDEKLLVKIAKQSNNTTN